MKEIEITSTIKGKYAEYGFAFLVYKSGNEYTDLSDNKEYQKKDIDGIVNNKYTVEIKNDLVINKTGNAVYEISTHTNTSDRKIIKNILDNNEYASINELSIYGYTGCNEKCEADYIIYFAVTAKDKTESEFILNTIYVIDNKKFKNYIHSNNFPTNRFRINDWRENNEDICNVTLLVKIDDLIKKGVARKISDSFEEIINENNDVFGEYNSSISLKEKLDKRL